MGPKQFHELVHGLSAYGIRHILWPARLQGVRKVPDAPASEDDSVVLGQVPIEEREIICEADPETFHFTDHYRNYPYVLARLKRLDAKTLRGYLTRQWRHNAPAKWLKAFDAGTELPELKTPQLPRKRARKTTR